MNKDDRFGPVTISDGIYAMLVTPFNPDETINLDALRAEIDWCVKQGAVGIVVTPSIGEFACLTDDERYLCMDACAWHLRSNYPSIVRIATVADTCTRKVEQHVQKALVMKYHAAQLIPPYYWHPVLDTEVFNFYKSVSEMHLPIVVYHNPRLSKVSMPPKFLGKLAELPGVVAIKETKTDRQEHLEPLFKAVAKQAKIFTTFRVFSTGLLMNSNGGFINVFALPFCVEMWRLHEEVNTGSSFMQIEKIQNMINEVFPRGGEDNPYHIGTTKMAASVVTGIPMGSPRHPYQLPDKKFEDELRKNLPTLIHLIQ